MSVPFTASRWTWRASASSSLPSIWSVMSVLAPVLRGEDVAELVRVHRDRDARPRRGRRRCRAGGPHGAAARRDASPSRSEARRRAWYRAWRADPRGRKRNVRSYRNAPADGPGRAGSDVVAAEELAHRAVLEHGPDRVGEQRGDREHPQVVEVLVVGDRARCWSPRPPAPASSSAGRRPGPTAARASPRSAPRSRRGRAADRPRSPRCSRCR